MSIYDKIIKVSDSPKYLNHTIKIEERVEDLIARMTLAEKLSQMLHSAPEIPRLGIPAYNWWSEALHGVSRAGIATVFPQAIAMASTFSPELIYETACAISDEARAKYHEAQRHGDRGIFKGLTLWCPNINIFRDPRWGRGHETYGEDPYLTGRMGVAFVNGLQGDHPKFLKTVATPKHAFAHSGPEYGREGFDSEVSARDLWDTYLQAFKECIQEAHAASIMTAYNRVNGEASSGSKTIIEDILREKLNFDGFVVSDCGAVCNMHNFHKITETPIESAALAANSGLDLNCGEGFNYLGAAVAAGLVSEETIDKAVKRLFIARFRLGMFDPDEVVPYAQIPYEVNDCDNHRELSLNVARQSIVLLKNKDNILPLSKEIKTIGVIGPNADSREVLLGNYNGWPSKYVTILDGIKNKLGENAKVYFTKGCEYFRGSEALAESTAGFSEAIAMAKRSDAVIMCLGLSPQIEGENGDAYNSDAGGDKKDLNLPDVQQKLLEAVCSVGKPVILVMVSGSAIAINWADENVSGIIQAFYPGQEGGNAVADVIFGDNNPSGRLPVTFYKTTEELPPFSDYNMKNRTYRYMENEALYPFGFGLSYTKFSYSKITINSERINAGESMEVSVNVKNDGRLDGEEVVQLYLKDIEASAVVPRCKLQGIAKVKLKPNENKDVLFTITPRQMALINNEGKCMLEPGRFRIFIGGVQPETERNEKEAISIKHIDFEVIGKIMEIEY